MVMKQNTQPIPIYRDNELDASYLKALQAASRRQKLHTTTKHLKRAGRAILAFLGIQMLQCYAGMLDGMYHTDTLQQLRHAE